MALASARPPGRRYTQELRFALGKRIQARAGKEDSKFSHGKPPFRRFGGSQMDLRKLAYNDEPDVDVELDPLDELCDALLRSTKYSLDMIITQPHMLPEYPGAYLLLSKLHPSLHGGETVIFAGTAPDGLRYTLNQELVAFPRRVDGVLARWRLDDKLRTRLKVQFVAGPYITHVQVVDHVTSQLGYCPQFNRGSSYALEESTKPWVTIETLRRQGHSQTSLSSSSSSSGSSGSSARSSTSSSATPSPASSPSPCKNFLPSADLSAPSHTRAVPKRVPPYEAARLCSHLLAFPASDVSDIQGTIPSTPGAYNLIDGESGEVLYTGTCPSLLRSLQRHIWPTGLDKFLVDLQLCGKLDCISVRVTASSLPRRGLRNCELVKCLRTKFRCNPVISEQQA